MVALLWTSFWLMVLAWIWPPLGGIGLFICVAAVIWGFLSDDDPPPRRRTVT